MTPLNRLTYHCPRCGLVEIAIEQPGGLYMLARTCDCPDGPAAGGEMVQLPVA